jgi:hypothetical protein
MGNGYFAYNGIEIPEHGSGSELHFGTTIPSKESMRMKTKQIYNRTVNK